MVIPSFPVEQNLRVKSSSLADSTMIRGGSHSMAIHVPTVARQYVSKSRFWMASTFICLMLIAFLYARGCLKEDRIARHPSQDGSIKTVSNDFQKSADVHSSIHQVSMHKYSHNSKRKDSLSQVFYGIMFDAGSTGSRIHVFQFSRDTQDSPLRLMNETFEQIKPGLSSYKKEPVKGAKSLVPLLNIAMSKIPGSKRPQTPVALKATAGLRLLPGNLADVILDEVGDVIDDYPFRFRNDSVQIMDGTDEGIFSWMTVNFLLGSLSGRNPLVAALDLGGGSTQITFVPHDTDSIDRAPKGFMTKVKLFEKNYQLYTHSYLGLGLMSARFQIMGGRDHSGKASVSKTGLSSPCLPDGFKETFEHHGNTFTVKMEADVPDRFSRCYKDVRRLIKEQSYNVDVVEELNNMPVYIFSYYFDRAVETGLIDAEKGGHLTSAHYKSKAKQICASPIKKHPYMCMDLVYIYSLLSDGFGLKKTKELTLKKQIDGVEISWALGAMFDMISDGEGDKSS